MTTTSCVLQTRPSMASSSKPIFFIFFIWATLIFQGVAGSRTVAVLPHKNSESDLQHTSNAVMGRRRMIGSVMPTCTYNECRGCRSRCRAEQVPVEGNDPINSAYHYRCVCHR